ncbi:phosphopantetheine-binding protein [Sneathia vaginalis]|uniref:phosphopantetheine-binding protein n=1 Tax=Sneathia vaginalis TaxID=187101 RepID=UPI00370D0C02
MDTINERIKKYSIFLESDIKDTDNLYDNGLDSLEIIDLILFIENEFSIDIDVENINYENFSSISKIEKFLKDKYKIIG